MAVTRAQKEVQVKELTEQFANASPVIFAHYIGLTVAQVSDLRKKLRSAKAEMKVAKKTLVRLASKAANQPEVHEDTLDGPVACIFSFDDLVSGAQVALAFAKTNPQVAIIGGVFDKKILSKADAMRLATVPSRQVLLATFASMIQSPLRSFAYACNAPITGFAMSLQELAKKKASSSAS